MSLDFFLQYGEYTLHSVAEDNEFNRSRHKQNLRGSICTRDRTGPMVKFSNHSFKDFSPKGMFLFSFLKR